MDLERRRRGTGDGTGTRAPAHGYDHAHHDLHDEPGLVLAPWLAPLQQAPRRRDQSGHRVVHPLGTGSGALRLTRETGSAARLTRITN